MNVKRFLSGALCAVLLLALCPAATADAPCEISSAEELSLLRETPDGVTVGRGQLLAAAARAGERGGERGGRGGRGGRAQADPTQPARALASLLADGLVATDDGGATYRLP